MTRPARHRAARFVAVAILALTVATIAGPEIVTTGGADPQPPSTQALLPDDAVHGTETVGVQPPRAPAIGRAAGIPTVQSVALVVTAMAAGLACVGACRCSRRRAGDRLPARGPVAWAGPGGRRAPPLARAA